MILTDKDNVQDPESSYASIRNDARFYRRLMRHPLKKRSSVQNRACDALDQNLFILQLNEKKAED